MVGTTVSHYRIVEQIGSGGMGVVYKAEDLVLGRFVALKFLPAPLASDSDALERFRREARSASALDHPNICTVHEIGEHGGQPFIVMALLDGQTLLERLSAPLALEEVVALGLQIADALEAAHARGIVHRDIKPGNIFITRRGQAKVLDFGLAKLTDDAGAGLTAQMGLSTRTGQDRLTRTGSALGTVAYMSPEQARGERVDARSDLFSLGAVLYEMATGRRLFGGPSAALVYQQILDAAPLSPRQAADLPSALEPIVVRLLEKDRALRYQSAADVRADLARLERTLQSGGTRTATAAPRRMRRRVIAAAGAVAIVVATVLAVTGTGWLAPPADAPIDSIAVLPFTNSGGNPDTEYLSDGLAESLINSLSRLGRLRVVPRSTVFRYKGREADPQAVGRELGVRAVLAGRVVQRGETLLIGVELVDIGSQSQLWGEQYTRPMADILAIQTEMTREISDSLRLRLTSEEAQHLARAYPQNTDAYRLYLHGLYHRQKTTEAGFRESVRYFRDAIDADPTYALAHAGLADTYNSLGYLRILAPRDVWPLSQAAARAALDLDDTLAPAHAALGAAWLFYDWDLEGARRALDRAIALDSGYATAYHWYAHYWIAQNRPDEVLAASRRAVELDPLDLMLNAHLLFMEALYRGRMPDAVTAVRGIAPEFWATHTTLGMFHTLEDRVDEGLRELEIGARSSAGMPLALSQLGLAYARAGRDREARRVAAQLEQKPYPPSLYIAPIYAALGDDDRALAWLEQAYEERASEFINLRYASGPLRSDPRVEALLTRAGVSLR